jgi:hypothetical protein
VSGQGGAMQFFVLVPTDGFGYHRRFHWSVGDYQRCSSVGGDGNGRFGGQRVSITAVGDGGGGPW